MAGKGNGAGADGGGNLLWSIIWFLILFFIGFWIAGFCAGFHILFQPFSVCIQGCNPILEVLMKGILLPRTCAENMVAGKAGF